jgi:hypothetical protein
VVLGSAWDYLAEKAALAVQTAMICPLEKPPPANTAAAVEERQAEVRVRFE